MRIRQAEMLLLALVWSAVLTHLSAADRPDGDHWQTEFNARLDASIARIQVEERGQATVSVGAISGESAPVPEVKPAAGLGKRDPQAAIARLLQERGLPPGLTSVVAVESAFNPLALSPKGARGLWQLMPATARRYGLTVAPHLDERTDPIRSTRAAAAYMKDLFTQVQDWPLALAAYKAGEDRVARAMTRTGARDFWTLRRHGALPDETLQYVPAILEKLERPLDAPGTVSPTSSDTRRKDKSPAGRIAYATPAVRE